MATLSERDTDRFFAWALLRPRTVIGSFKSQGPSLSRTLWIIAIITIVSIATIAWKDIELQKLSLGSEPVFGGLLADSIIFGSVDAFLYPAEVFVWSYLFGFRNDQAGVRAAVDVSYAYGMVVTLMGTVLHVSMLRSGMSQQSVEFALVPELAAVIGIIVFCFKTALGISWLKSISLNMAMLLLILIGVVFTYAGWAVVDAIMTGYLS